MRRILKPVLALALAASMLAAMSVTALAFTPAPEPVDGFGSSESTPADGFVATHELALPVEASNDDPRPDFQDPEPDFDGLTAELDSDMGTPYGNSDGGNENTAPDPALVPPAAGIEIQLNADGFELPLDGATGYAVAAMTLRAKPDAKSAKLASIPAGGMFVIRANYGPYLSAEYDGTYGFVPKAMTMINLPDVLPSVRYINSNTESSLFRSSGKALNNITGEALYAGKTENARLGYAEHNMPVLYAMSQKIALAQQAALKNGDCVMLYESYRPLAVQKQVNAALSALIKSDKTVAKAINDGIWGQGWFIAQSRSNHQLGCAVDVSLGQVRTLRTIQVGGMELNIPDEVAEHTMPAPMHELSNKSAALRYGVDSKSTTAWKKVPYAAGMTDGAKALRDYFTGAGMTPLASEYWHFNDLAARQSLLASVSPTGGFEIQANCSRLWA